MEYIDLLEKNFYNLLGLDQNKLYDSNGNSVESEDEIDAKIEEAYNKKVSETAKDSKQSKLLKDAYNVLKDRKRRNEYNQLRKLVEKYNEEKKVKKETRKEVIKEVKEDKEIEFIPIYRGKFGKIAPKKSEDKKGEEGYDR